MIIKRNDGWHVISESGKNLGGPYENRLQAAKRLQQVEYFKRRGKTAETIDNLYAKALVGRINVNSPLFPSEKKLKDKLLPLPTKNSYPKERLATSPLATIAIKGIPPVAGLILLQKYFPKLTTKALRYAASKVPMPLEQYVKEWAQINEKLPTKRIVNTFANWVTSPPKLLTPYEAIPIALIPGYIKMKQRTNFAKSIENSTSDSEALMHLHKQLKKSAGFSIPIGAIDDVAYLTSKVIQETDPGVKVKNQLPVKKVKKEIKSFEKEGAVFSQAKALYDRLNKLPLKTYEGIGEQVNKYMVPKLNKLEAYENKLRMQNKFHIPITPALKAGGDWTLETAAIRKAKLGKFDKTLQNIATYGMAVPAAVAPFSPKAAAIIAATPVVPPILAAEMAGVTAFQAGKHIGRGIRKSVPDIMYHAGTYLPTLG